MNTWNKKQEVLSTLGGMTTIYENRAGLQLLRLDGNNLRSAIGMRYNENGDCILIASGGGISRVDESLPELFQLNASEGVLEYFEYGYTSACGDATEPRSYLKRCIQFEGASPARSRFIAQNEFSTDCERPSTNSNLIDWSGVSEYEHDFFGRILLSVSTTLHIVAQQHLHTKDYSSRVFAQLSKALWQHGGGSSLTRRCRHGGIIAQLRF